MFYRWKKHFAGPCQSCCRSRCSTLARCSRGRPAARSRHDPRPGTDTAARLPSAPPTGPPSADKPGRRPNGPTARPGRHGCNGLPSPAASTGPHLRSVSQPPGSYRPAPQRSPIAAARHAGRPRPSPNAEVHRRHVLPDQQRPHCTLHEAMHADESRPTASAHPHASTLCAPGMKPVRRRQLVDELRDAWKVSTRRACAVIRMATSTYHTRGKRRSQAALIVRV
jgi:hypothetical protein